MGVVGSDVRAQGALAELVAEVAAELIGSPLGSQEEAESAIERALGRIAVPLGGDGAYFLRDARRPADAVFVEWAKDRPGRRERDRLPLSEQGERWWAEQMAGGVPVHIQDVAALAADDPSSADVGPVMTSLGVASVLLVPLHRHPRFSGFLGLVSSEPGIRCAIGATSLLRIAGECFMGALQQADAAAELTDARRELEQRNLDLERSNEDLERFAYAAAHDLKAPLARIEMALAGAPSSEHAEELLTIARRSAVRMRQLIEDLLAYAAVGAGSGQVEEVDLDAVLSEVLLDLAPSLNAGGVTIERSPLPTVMGRRAPLSQLLQNVVGNSLKFARTDVDPVVRISAQAEGGGVTIRVADNGIGIERSQRSAVFGVFTRLHGEDRYPGSGIGLATCAKVVARHGGRIWIDEGLDGGAGVSFWLPHTTS